MSLTESIVADAALGCFLRQGYGGQVGDQPSSRLRLTRLGYAVGHGPQMAPGEPAPEPACASHADRRDAFGEVVQSRCHVVDGRGRLLVVQKTGWGKSFVYFIAAKLLREEGLGAAILISPLLALLRNQIAAAERMGVRAFTIHSGNQDQWQAVEAALQRNAVDILLISPERLANDYFRTSVLAPVAGSISLLVVDEAHCISDWGHDFRPHYRLIERMVRTLPPNLRVLATTATANNRVLADLQTVLGPSLTVSRGELGRPSLLLQTMRMPSQAGRMAWLATQLPTIEGTDLRSRGCSLGGDFGFEQRRNVGRSRRATRSLPLCSGFCPQWCQRRQRQFGAFASWRQTVARSSKRKRTGKGARRRGRNRRC